MGIYLYIVAAVLTAVCLIWANLWPHWLLMAHSRAGDSVVLYSGWPLAWRMQTMFHEAGASQWEEVSNSIEFASIVANFVLGAIVVAAGSANLTSIGLKFWRFRFCVADILTATSVVAIAVGWPVAEQSLTRAFNDWQLLSQSGINVAARLWLTVALGGTSVKCVTVLLGRFVYRANK